MPKKKAGEDLAEERKFSMGHTVITCRRCKTMTAIENMTLEAMVEHRCPNCGRRMTDRELARLKMHYYYLVTKAFDDGPFGAFREFFDYDIQLNPHFETDVSNADS